MTETLDRPETRAQVEARRNGSGMQTALATMAQRYQISQEGLADVIRKTCIQGECSEAQFKAFVLVANQYGLNPMTREIHAFTDPRRGVVPIVGIDGWSRIVNGQGAFDGCEFEEVEKGDDLGMTCTMFVKGRSHPIKVTEWLSECKRNTPPWNTMKRRMLRHKAFIQASRLAFSIGGIFDEDEARDIVHNASAVVEQPQRGVAGVLKKLTARPVSEGQTLADSETGEVIQEGDSLQSHDFARPGAHEQESKEMEDVPEKAEEHVDDAATPMSDNEVWWVKLREIAEGLPEDNLINGVAHWRKGKSVMALKEHLAKPKDQKELFDAIQNREGTYFSVAR